MGESVELQPHTLFETMRKHTVVDSRLLKSDVLQTFSYAHVSMR
jgi:hypothetical protein